MTIAITDETLLAEMPATQGLTYRRFRGESDFPVMAALARALIAISLQMHKDLDTTEAALGVDTENLTGALRVYEACGFHAVKHFSNYRKGL